MTQQFDIGVCTFRRPHLAQTLKSLAALELPEGWAARVIVADNDETPSARALVEQVVKETGMAITYIHAPARNISIARNACLDAAAAPFFAFVDDDELVTPGWLAALYSALADGTADAALGPVRAVYREGAPRWLVQGDFHSIKPVWVHGAIVSGYTCNVLFRRTAPVFSALRFRPEFGRSGGEDSAFFMELSQGGGKIAYAPQAVVSEAVPPERESFLWLVMRRYRSGQTHGILIRERHTSAMLAVPRALCKLAIFAFMALLTCLNAASSRGWLLRGALQAGIISSYLKIRMITQYGHDKP